MSDFDPVWRGTQEIVERLGSPKLKKTVVGWRVTRTYDGPFTALVNNAPAIGANMVDMGILQVDDVEIEPQGGGVGMMTVILASDSIGGLSDPALPVYEIEWIEVQKDITRHPRYQAGGDDELNDDELVCLRKARAGDTDAIAQITSNAFADDSLTKIWKKILAGNDDFVEYIPVITETITQRTPPQDTNAGAGFIDMPPTALRPAGWVWLRTSAPTTREGTKWTVRRQWTGARAIDTDIYSTTAIA